MAEIIGLPKLSPTMEEGVLVRWVKKEGDRVQPGDLIAEVETDKANMDFNLEDEGVLLKLLVAEGDTIRLGAPVAILGDEGEDITALVDQARAQMGGAAAPTAGSAEPERPATAAKPERADGGGAAPAAEQREEPARGGPSLRVAPPPAEAGQRSNGNAAAPPAGGRLLASPLAKQLAAELGVDLRRLRGTGPGGRIVERDVRAAADGGHGGEEAPRAAEAAPARERRDDTRGPDEPGVEVLAAPRPGPSAAPTPSAALAVLPRGGLALPPTEHDYEDRPLSNMRKRIAQRMMEAKQGVPHFYLTSSFDAQPLLDFRRRLNRLLGERGKVTVNDLIVKGAALALRRVPEVNAAFLGEAIRYHSRVHIGVAVATENGLVTPVVRDADIKGLAVIGAEVRDLAERARNRALKAHDIQGSTFTVSNLGMFGIDHFEAIINPPEAAILAIGTVRKQPVVVGDAIVIGERMALTLSCDHRVVDGALGARFLDALVAILEGPEALAL
jgi:pyruvate dehydrogenase E2 component (dihydrolipoamide acetyltransferase)